MKTITLGAALFLAISGAGWAAEGPGAHFVENWDLDGDGAVTVVEARERRSDVFASFDANEDGFLDAEEYVLFDEARAQDQAANEPQGMGRGAGNPANGMALDVNDTDGDGKVSEAEFLDNAQAWIEMIDRNGDGVVTMADFGQRR
ncbi:hypothetical protein ACSSV1_002560 [Labrenzia sp. MBR-25]|jgi:hypothetical protein